MATRGSSSRFEQPFSTTLSGLESVLRLPSFTESDKGLLTFTNEGDDDFIDLALSKEHEEKKFVKLKRNHWVDPRSRNCCFICKKAFGLTLKITTKKFNCRRCGEIFCERCCNYRRRLGPDSKPSPDGNYYRVCYGCSDHDVQTPGVTRSLTDSFKHQRGSKRINVLKELDRLVDGFKQHVKASRINSVITDTFSNIKVPLWQRSYKWLESKEVEWCSKCSAKFSLFMQKHHCRICGSVFCNKCCNQDLMLYYSDDTVSNWALIKLVGCPDKEPNACIYLTICSLCHEDVANFQVYRYYEAKKSCELNMRSLSDTLERIIACQDKLKENLIVYQEMVENMIGGKGELNKISGSGKSVVQTFAKLQVDITDLFNNFIQSIQELKQIKMITQKESLLLFNCLQVKVKYYNNNMSTFKFYKDILSKTMPLDALKQVQDYADLQAMNSTRITTKLLGIEVLNLVTEHSLDASLALKISSLDDVCLSELTALIKGLGEDWDEHNERLNLLVKEMFGAKRMLVPSVTQTRRRGSDYLDVFLMERSNEILRQTQRQMLARSSEKRFVKSKEALKSLIEYTAENSFSRTHSLLENEGKNNGVK
eukprot:gene10909-12068_t